LYYCKRMTAPPALLLIHSLTGSSCSSLRENMSEKITCVQVRTTSAAPHSQWRTPAGTHPA
jgi:hypothetical protein